VIRQRLSRCQWCGEVRKIEEKIGAAAWVVVMLHGRCCDSADPSSPKRGLLPSEEPAKSSSSADGTGAASGTEPRCHYDHRGEALGEPHSTYVEAGNGIVHE